MRALLNIVINDLLKSERYPENMISIMYNDLQENSAEKLVRTLLTVMDHQKNMIRSLINFPSSEFRYDLKAAWDSGITRSNKWGPSQGYFMPLKKKVH